MTTLYTMLHFWYSIDNWNTVLVYQEDFTKNFSRAFSNQLFLVREATAKYFVIDHDYSPQHCRINSEILKNIDIYESEADETLEFLKHFCVGFFFGSCTEQLSLIESAKREKIAHTKQVGVLYFKNWYSHADFSSRRRRNQHAAPSRDSQ